MIHIVCDSRAGGGIRPSWPWASSSSLKRAVLIAQPGKVPTALEEMLRYAPPSFHIGMRRTRCPIRLGDLEVPGDTTLDVVIGVANRDPRHFRDPGRTDFDRGEAQHLSFGYGASYCPGARLARIQAEIAIRAMLPYIENLTLAIPVGQIEWSDRRPGYGTMLEALPVIRCEQAHFLNDAKQALGTKHSGYPGVCG
jgi:cytochrome P450